jgi:predicted Zn-dependent protease
MRWHRAAIFGQFARRVLSGLSLGALIMGTLGGCAEAPVTEKQPILISESQEMALGLQAYRQILKEEALSTDPASVGMVERVGQRIAAVVDRPDFQWEFAVVEDDRRAHAFCLPGGKVAVYKGLFRYIYSDADLAAVIGHGVAHVIARHGAARMSRMLLARMGETSLKDAVANKSPEAVKALRTAYGAGVTVGSVPPFSDQEELEADHAGLVYMAQANYDPTAAIEFWERVLRLDDRGVALEISSAHPVDRYKIGHLKQALPQAMVYYHRQIPR